MSLNSRLAIATMGYRGGFTGDGISETRYVLQEISVLEMDQLLNSNITIESLGVNTTIEEISANVDYVEVEGAYLI